MANEKIIELKPIKISSMIVKIEGTSELVLNKMNARATRMLLADDRKGIREVPNRWEDAITAIHWRDPIDEENLYETADEKMMEKLLKKNAPCIPAFAIKKTMGQAVVRNEIDKYATKLDNAVNIRSNNGNVPITFAGWMLEQKLMSPKRGAPVSVVLNVFSGWGAEFQVDFTEHVYSQEQLVNIINLAGFGIGLGSGRSSGFGRYKVVDVKGV